MTLSPSDPAVVEQVRQYRAKIEASKPFLRESIDKALLRFLVDEWIAGNGDQIKAWHIVDAGVIPPVRPQSSARRSVLRKTPVVQPAKEEFSEYTENRARVAGGRLRLKLLAYYASDDGKFDPIRIVIPSGGYKPEIEPWRAVPTGGPVYDTTRPLPRFYIHREEVLSSLRNVVMAERASPQMALTAIHGMGGVGKTVLAQALCRDEIIRRQFPDGIIWISIGRESQINIVDQMREVAKVLRDHLDSYDTPQGCINQYRTIIRNRSALIVLDDVWRASDLEPFLADAPQSRLLFTTRDVGLLSSLDAQQYGATLLSEQESSELFAKSCNTLPLPLEAKDLIRKCGRHPLALSMIGAMVRGQPLSYWKHVHNLLRQADLENIHADLLNYPHRDLFRSMKVSVDALGAQERTRYLALAVLLEDMLIPPAIQQQLWNANEFDAVGTAETFVGLSLAERDGRGGISLHDLQLAYIRARYPDRRALELLRGAVRLSAHVLCRDVGQFASQMFGRLLRKEFPPAIHLFTTALASAHRYPWLRPLCGTLRAPGTGLSQTLESHADHVYAVAVTPDGQSFVSASKDKTLKIWDLETGRELRTLEGHSGPVTCVALSPDGRRAVSGSEDKTLKVWDLDTGRELRTLEGHAEGVHGVAVTPDGQSFVSASKDKTLKIWDLETGRELRTLEGHSGPVTCVALSPDGRRAVSGSEDKTLKVWDLDTGRELRALEGHPLRACVTCVALSPDGRRAFTGSFGGLPCVWDLDTGLELRVFKSNYSCVGAVAVFPDGLRGVVAYWSGMFKVWDLHTGRELQTFIGHWSLAYSLAITPDGRRVVSGSYDNTLRVWNLNNGLELPTVAGHSDSVIALAVTPDGRSIVSASNDKTLKIWDLETGRELRTLEGHSDGVSHVAVTPDGRSIVSASNDKTLKIWDLETGRELRTLEGHDREVVSLAMSSNGRLVVYSSDHSQRVWEIDTGLELRNTQGRYECAHSVLESPESRIIISTYSDGISFRDLETGRELRTLEGHSGPVTCVALSPDGRRAVSGSEDKTLKVWDLDTGRELRTLEGHADVVLGVEVTPDGRSIVSASLDKTLKIWDLESGREIRTLEGHSGRLRGAAISSDGRRVVSGSIDRTLRVWDLDHAGKIATFTSDWPISVCLFAGSGLIVAGDESGQLHFLSYQEGTTSNW